MEEFNKMRIGNWVSLPHGSYDPVPVKITAINEGKADITNKLLHRPDYIDYIPIIQLVPLQLTPAMLELLGIYSDQNTTDYKNNACAYNRGSWHISFDELENLTVLHRGEKVFIRHVHSLQNAVKHLDGEGIEISL